MSKQNAMPGYYGRTADASAEQIADAAMRAYGHPWHARKTLLAQRVYCAEMQTSEPKHLDGAIELLEERSTGTTTKQVERWPRGTETRVSVYDIGAVLDAWGAPFAPSGVRDLCAYEQVEFDNWLFAGTLRKALEDIGRAVYDSHIFTLTSKGGKTLYTRCADYEKARRTRKGRNATRVYLCDANGVEASKPNKYGGTDALSIAFGSIASCERNGLREYTDYIYAQTQVTETETA